MNNTVKSHNSETSNSDTYPNSFGSNKIVTIWVREEFWKQISFNFFDVLVLIFGRVLTPRLARDLFEGHTP